MSPSEVLKEYWGYDGFRPMQEEIITAALEGKDVLNYGTPAGAAVASVTEGGPADKAGLQTNDIITAVDGTEISGKSDLSSIIADHAAGDKLTLSVYRQGQTLTLTVEIGEQTTSAIADQQDSQQSQSQQQTPGFFGFGG